MIALDLPRSRWDLPLRALIFTITIPPDTRPSPIAAAPREPNASLDTDYFWTITTNTHTVTTTSSAFLHTSQHCCSSTSTSPVMPYNNTPIAPSKEVTGHVSLPRRPLRIPQYSPPTKTSQSHASKK